MNIVLIGYRGTGKSAVSSIVAEKLGMEIISMDAEIVRLAGRPIPQIVEEEGWPGFRDRESALAAELSKRDGLIIDCGGGIIERPENIEALKKNGQVFWLKSSVDTIVRRIEGDTQRPSLTKGRTFTEEVSEVLAVRTPKYSAAADFEVDTDTVTPLQVAEVILQKARGC